MKVRRSAVKALILAAIAFGYAAIRFYGPVSTDPVTGNMIGRWHWDWFGIGAGVAGLCFLLAEFWPKKKQSPTEE